MVTGHGVIIDVGKGRQQTRNLLELEFGLTYTDSSLKSRLMGTFTTSKLKTVPLANGRLVGNVTPSNYATVQLNCALLIKNSLQWCL